jgi:hypothetical protein
MRHQQQPIDADAMRQLLGLAPTRVQPDSYTADTRWGVLYIELNRAFRVEYPRRRGEC